MENIIEIPEGYEARIEGNKVILEPKESEDEIIRKALLNAFQESEDSLHMVLTPHKRETIIAWLEKQKNNISLQELLTSFRENTNENWDFSKTPQVREELNKCFGKHMILPWNDNTRLTVSDLIRCAAHFYEFGKKEQSPAWSEEDEKNLNSVERIIENSENLNKVFETINSPEYIKKHFIDWFKSFKERIQPNQSLHPRYIEGKGIYIPVIDVVLNMQDEPEKLTWYRAKDIALSKEQMFVVLYYKDEINALLEQHDGQKLEGWHWTSTHFSNAMVACAWGLSFDDSRVRDDSCDYFYKVRSFSAYHSES